MAESKKTIVIFSAFFEPFEGGAERYVREITERLKEKYHFIILTGRFSRSLAKKENKGGVEVNRLGLGLKKLDKYLFVLLAPLKALFLKPKPGLVHAVLESYAGLALFFYKILRPGAPALLTLQSGRVRMPKPLFKSVHRRADKIQAISSALAWRARKFGAQKVEIVPNGIDLSKFKDLEGIERQKHQIITVAHLKKVKGLNYLIAAMPSILADFPRANLLLVGDGPERGRLAKLVNELDLAGKVKFAGRVPSREVPRFLAQAGVFCLPSLAEGMGIAVLEAMAAQTPVAAANVGGILDLVQTGANGLLFKPGQPQEIAEAVKRLFADAGFAKSLTGLGLRKAGQYDWHQISQRIDKIYQQGLRKRVLLVCPALASPAAGTANYTQHLKKELIKQGLKVKTVSQAKAKQRAWLRAVSCSWAVLRRTRLCQIIYCFNLISAGLPAVLANTFLKRKLVVRIGGDYLWERAFEKGRTTKTLREYYQEKKTFKERCGIFCLNFVLKRVDKVIFTTVFQRQLYLKHYKLIEEKTTVIENPFPFPRLSSPSPEGRGRNKEGEGLRFAFCQILYAGRFLKLKNLAMLIDVFAQVLQKTEKALTLKLIGQGPEEKSLKLKVKSAKLENRVKILPPLPQKQLFQEIAKSWLCVLPSLTDISPNFALEAIALEKPILLTKETGLYEQFKNHLIFIEPQKPRDLQVKLLALLAPVSYDIALSMIKRLDKSYSWEQVVSRHLDIFNSL